MAKFNPEVALAQMKEALQPKEGYVRSQSLVGGELSREFREIGVDEIIPSPYQPRIDISEEHVIELAVDIDARGLTHPICVRPRSDGGFELIAGEARWRAFKHLNRATIPAIVRVVSEYEAMWSTLTENVQRERMSDLETARAMKMAMDKGGISSPTEVHRAFRINRADVYRYTAFFDLPQALFERIERSHRLISRTIAYELLKLHEQFGEATDGFIEAAIVAIDMLERGELRREALTRKVVSLMTEDQESAADVKKGVLQEVPIRSSEGVALGRVQRKSNRLVIGLNRNVALPVGIENELAEFLLSRLKSSTSDEQ